MSHAETAALATREKRTPAELIREGREQAKALMEIVKEAGLSKDLGGAKNHLEVEAWQTIGRFNGFLTDIAWCRPVVEDGAKVGYEARAELVRIEDGFHLIGAEAGCRFDEEIERKDGSTFIRWDDDYAVRSMAQTRAQSKLGRMAFAWVAVLAGYSGTPAEEMDGVKGRSGKLTFPFGAHKGKAPADLDPEALHKELAFWEKQVADPKNKYTESNKKLVAAIQEALAEKTAKPTEPAEDAHGFPGKVIPPTPEVPLAADEPTEREKAWALVKEVRESRGLTAERVKAVIKRLHGVRATAGDLSLLQIQNLAMVLKDEE